MKPAGGVAGRQARPRLKLHRDSANEPGARIEATPDDHRIGA